MPNGNTPLSSTQEKYVLSALADVRKLVFYKLSSLHRDSAEDIIQRVFCKIWTWKTRHNKILEYDDWRKVTKMVVYREINEYFSEKYTKDIPFSQIDASLREAFLAIKAAEGEVEGNTRTETRSLLKSFWKAAQILTLRQKYAFVLHSEDFLIEFISAGCCTHQELAAYFELPEDVLSDIIELFPLSDGQIGELLSVKLSESVTPQQIWEARAKAKSKLLRYLKQPTT